MKLLTNSVANKISVWYVNITNGYVGPKRFVSSKWYMLNADQAAVFTTIKVLLKRSME